MKTSGDFWEITNLIKGAGRWMPAVVIDQLAQYGLRFVIKQALITLLLLLYLSYREITKI
jgi:hypothetical protein